LTARERADVKYRKDILDYAKKHERAGEIEKEARYHMPDAKVVREVPKEYVEEPAGGDGRRWEDERLLAAMQHYGAKDADKARPEFPLLLEDDKIDFVQALQMPGIGDQVCALDW
jgi:pre-mRNA-splicing factor ATP-dependent RNA helicase DHX16